MSEAGLRQALVAAIIAAVVGVAALAVGAFIAPIPNQTDASQVATALFVRGVLALSALALALFLAYWSGFRIETAAGAQPITPPADPSASSALLSLFTTPGSRRDALFSGGIVTLVYWLLTSLYILALGKVIGNIGVNSADISGFLWSRALQGVALIIVGMGCGSLGARAALARRVTRKALSIPSIPSDQPPSVPPPPTPPVSDTPTQAE
jgi:hypothetical protein